MPSSRDPERPRRFHRDAKPANTGEPVPDTDLDAAEPDDPDADAAVATVARRRAASEAERRAMFAALLADDPFIDEEPEPADGPHPHVTAVLVAHDGASWLPATLAAIDAQTRRPDQIVAVDTGSNDQTAELLTRGLGSTAVVTLPRTVGYGSAVVAALASHEPPAQHEADRREWIWLLHDDSAPDPTALERLLDHARRNPSIGLLGVKAVDWTHSDRLVEVGLTTDRAGRRITDLDHFELDQGQHDQPRDMLAVGTAGALVRREVWDEVGGFDPDLPLLREDIDLGWRVTVAGYRVVVVPAARIRHARATLSATRSRDALPGRLRRHDREHGLRVVLANSGGLAGGLAGLPLVVLAAALRSLVLLVTRRPRQASDEITAALLLLAHPMRLARGRRRRRRIRTSPHAARPYLIRTGSRIRTRLLATTDVFASSGELAGSALPEDEDDIPGDDSTLIRRLVLRPAVGLVVVLTVVGLVAERSLLHHGTLSGGRLLPATDSARVLWRSYAASWHPGAFGSASPASPWDPVLATFAIPFGGNPQTALTGLMLLAFPLAGLSAWLATRRTGLSTRLRLWAAVTYAVLPPLGAAVAFGRFDAVVAIVGVPLLLSAGHRLFSSDPQLIGWNHPFAAGFGLAIVCAFYPPAYVVAVLLVGVGAVVAIAAAANSTRISASRRALAGVLMLAVPPLLLFPYAPSLFVHPRQFLVGLGAAGGLAGQYGSSPGGWDLLLLHPGGPLQPSLVLTVPLVLAAAVGLLRRAWWRVAAVAAAIVVGAYGLALVIARTGAARSGVAPYGWSGVALSVAGAGLVLAALVAGRRARETYSGLAFGLRQPLGVVVALLAVAAPVALGLALMTSGTDGPLARRSGSDLPAFVSDDATRDPGQRLLRLEVRPDETIGFQLTRVDGAALGDEDLFPSARSRDLVGRLVADLASDRGTDAAEVLSTFHVDYVALPAQDADKLGGLANVLDAQPALSRFAVPGGTQLWQVLVHSSRLQVLTGPLATSALNPAPVTDTLGRGPLLSAVEANPPISVPSGAEGARGSIPAARDSSPRVLVLADSRDGNWRATLDGRRLVPTTAWNWAQAFVVPPGGGKLRVWHDASGRRAALIVEAVLLGVIVVLGAPSVRRRQDPLDLEQDV